MKKTIKTIIVILLMAAVGAVHAYGQWKQPVYDTTVDAAEYQNVGEISGESKIEQEFTAEYDGVNALLIRTSTWGRVNDSEMKYTLTKVSDDSVVTEGVFKVSEVTDNEYKEIYFPEIEESKGERYRFRIEADGIKTGEGISIFTTKKAKSAEMLTVNGAEQEQALVMKIQAKEFNWEDFIVLIGLQLYVVGFVKLLYRFLK
nr:hypothetical protein [uncultured Faecalimonas sp.]